ncbi:MAG: cytochrome c biogenesis protein ResB [Nitrospirae bacterium]|nr:cytochrome c biogenesis protein ResB [Nitrospirota bacterium]
MLYKILSSLKTSVIILTVMCLVFLIGTIFPQGEYLDKYIKAGGKFVTIVRAMDFLDIFMSPLFIFISGILMINLAVCLYDRLKIFLKFKRTAMDFERLKTHPHVITCEQAGIEDRTRKIGFKPKAGSKDIPSVRIFEKGLQYWWLSWFYHVGIILAVLGFFITALFSFEGEVVLYPGKPNTISLYSKETRWNIFLKNIGRKVADAGKEDEYVLTLKEFQTEYYQGLKIDYPDSKLERLALGAGIRKIEPSKKGFSYMPRMWLTHLEVTRPDGKVLDARMWVNKPFRTGPLTLYQMGYEQKTKLSVNNEVMEVENRIPFEIKNVKGKFVLGSLTLGTLFKKDGSQEKIIPASILYYIPDEKPAEKEELGKLSPGERLNAKDVSFEFKGYEEASYLSYRKDPGVWLVGLACLFVFTGLFVRSFGAWYRIQYAVEGQTAYVLISTRGILADKDRIIRRLHFQ